MTSNGYLPAAVSLPVVEGVVLIAHVSARKAALEEYMKVWVGYITAETFEEMEPYLDGMQIDQPFKVPAGSDYLPYAPALIEALDERFAFLSAESGLGDTSVVREEGQEYGLGEGSDIPTRVASLESLMDKMNGNLETVLEKLGHLPNRKAAPAPGRVSFAAAPIEVPARSTRLDPLAKKFPGLDAAVVSAALAAGVPEENLTEMQRLIGAGGKATHRLREPALRASAKKEAKKTAEPLDESEDEVEPDLVLDEPGSALAGGPATVEGALAKLTELVAILSDDKLKRAKSTKMDLALDSIANSSGVGESSSGSTGKRAAAARRALRVGLQESPEEISAVVEKLLLEDLVLKTQAPGMPANDFNARGLGGASQQDRSIQDLGVHGMGRSGSARRSGERPGESCSSSSRAYAGDAGPGCHRPWFMGAGSRIDARAGSPSLCIGVPYAPVRRRRRVPLQQDSGQQMGRSDAEPSTRCRRLPAEAADPWEKAERRRGEGQGEGGGEAAEAQGKGKGEELRRDGGPMHEEPFQG